MSTVDTSTTYNKTCTTLTECIAKTCNAFNITISSSDSTICFLDSQKEVALLLKNLKKHRECDKCQETFMNTAYGILQKIMHWLSSLLIGFILQGMG